MKSLLDINDLKLNLYIISNEVVKLCKKQRNEISILSSKKKKKADKFMWKLSKEKKINDIDYEVSTNLNESDDLDFLIFFAYHNGRKIKRNVLVHSTYREMAKIAIDSSPENTTVINETVSNDNEQFKENDVLSVLVIFNDSKKPDKNYNKQFISACNILLKADLM